MAGRAIASGKIAVSVSVHAAAATLAAHDSELHAATVTVPAGVPAAALTVKRTVTACPTSDGSGSSAVIVVVVAAGSAGVTATVSDVTGTKPSAWKASV